METNLFYMRLWMHTVLICRRRLAMARLSERWMNDWTGSLRASSKGVKHSSQPRKGHDSEQVTAVDFGGTLAAAAKIGMCAPGCRAMSLVK